jgi:cytochrome c oxidase subunit IV
MELSREEGIKRVTQGLFILGGVTIAEVLISLLGKGHIVSGLEDYRWIFYITGVAMILLSFYKAYFIIYEFMHLKYEVKTLARTVLLPTTLLIWGIIAFLWEGNTWGERREEVQYEIPAEVDKQLQEEESAPLDDMKLQEMGEEKEHHEGH